MVRGIAAIVVVALAATVFLVVRSDREQHFVLMFTQTKNLHVGDSVTVLDVKVGTITAIHPEASQVRVDVKVRNGLSIPASAHATIVAPSLVSVRHIELSPVYRGGATLRAGATIPLARTAVPVEWDEVTKQLTQLATVLGPKGADKTGSLSRLLKTTASNLDGEGPSLSDTISSLSKAMTTLSDNRGNIVSTLDNLQVFVDALASSDATVHDFTAQLASLSGSLSGDRHQLKTALPALADALKDVQRFLKKNAGETTTSVSHLRQLSQSLASHRQGLADILQSAPTAMANYYDIYDPDVPAMTGVFVGANFESPATFLCSTLYSLGQSPSQCQNLLEPIAKYFATQLPPVGVNPIDRNGRGNNESSPSSGSTPAPSTGSGSGGGSGSTAQNNGLLGGVTSSLGQLLLGGLTGGAK